MANKNEQEIIERIEDNFAEWDEYSLHEGWWNDWEADRANDDWSEECAFPGRCCMPGPHYRFECHTPEMIEKENNNV